MRLGATDFYTVYRPAECDLRVCLKYKDLPEAPPNPCEQVIRRGGVRHEKNHLLGLPAGVDLSLFSMDEPLHRTGRSEI
jgi:hypothetical protein